MAGIGVWLEGATPGNIILPLILMGVEVTESGTIRDHYYTLWSQGGGEVEFYIGRLYTFMGWTIDTPMDEEALTMAMRGGRLLRAEYIKLWDMQYPTLRLKKYGCHMRPKLRQGLRAMPVRLPFVADKPWADDYRNVHTKRKSNEHISNRYTEGTRQ